VNWEPLLHIVLVEPEIPQNTGNIGRTCVALGAKLWLVRPLGFRMDDRNLRRAGLDYWDHLQWEAVDGWTSLQDRLAGRNLWYFSKTSRIPYTAASFERGDALVFGSETRGLPKGLLEAHTDRVLGIPMRPEARSLNLATAVAVGAYEAARQMGLLPETVTGE